MLPLWFLLFLAVSSARNVEIVPPNEVHKLTNSLIDQASKEIPKTFPIPDSEYKYNEYFLGILFHFEWIAKDGVLNGPEEIVSSGIAKAQHLPSGSSIINFNLDVGDVVAQFGYFYFDFFGIAGYQGSAVVSVHSATIPVQINVYKNVIAKCQVDVSVSGPNGNYDIQFGNNPWNPINVIFKLFLPYLSLNSEFYSALPTSFFTQLSNAIQSSMAKSAHTYICD